MSSLGIDLQNLVFLTFAMLGTEDFRFITDQGPVLSLVL
jgi:hypothetical protein